MRTGTARTRHRQRVEELSAASIRALSGEPDLHYRGGRLHRGESAVPANAPHLRTQIEDDDFGSFRGAADGLALRVAHSDSALHESLAPDGDVQTLVFEMLEQFRVESVVNPRLRGVVANLRHRHQTWSQSFYESGLTETTQGMLLYTVAQICRSKVTGEPVVEETEDMLEYTRFALAPLIGTELSGLRRRRTDQRAYAALARSIAEKVAGMLAVAVAEQLDSADDVHRGSRNGFSLFVGNEGDDRRHVGTAPHGSSPVLAGAEQGYHVFTREYDRELTMAQLVRPSQLLEYRERLDDQVDRAGVNVRHIGSQLRHVLTEPDHEGWDADREEGLVDGRSLTRLITSPTDHRLFRSSRVEPVPDCIVSILLDCSGSMRRHHESVGVVVDILARALDLADIGSEILGFTTGAWNGGRAMRDWKQAGQPTHPGRLNERLHLTLKDADTSWRRARPSIAGLLRQDLYREAIDGEAVAWACTRLRGRPESRRILLVISDGSPMDGATNLANDPHYLGEHLRRVDAAEKSAGSVSVCGLGVGLDLSPYYAHNHVIDLDRGVQSAMFGEILALLAAAGTAGGP